MSKTNQEMGGHDDAGVWAAIRRLLHLCAVTDAAAAKLDEAAARIEGIPRPAALCSSKRDVFFATELGAPLTSKDIDCARFFAARLKLSDDECLPDSVKNCLARFEEIDRAASVWEEAVAAIRKDLGIEAGAEEALDALCVEVEDAVWVLRETRPLTVEALRAALVALLRADAFDRENSADQLANFLSDTPALAAAAGRTAGAQALAEHARTLCA